MSKQNEVPSVTLQTMVMAIQVIDKEISEIKKIYKQGTDAADDDTWLHDLERAAANLEEVYTYTIKTKAITNFPKYEQLVSRKSDS